MWYVNDARGGVLPVSAPGKGLLRRLERHGIKCTYIWLNALTYVMKVGGCPVHLQVPTCELTSPCFRACDIRT